MNYDVIIMTLTHECVYRREERERLTKSVIDLKPASIRPMRIVLGWSKDPTISPTDIELVPI